MPRGISIHIGLNFVDPARYNGWDGQLSGCINDARDMKAIADGIGYQSSIMTDSQATAATVLQAIGQAAQQLDTGDTLLLTYSGHGGQVPDANGDETDGQDETWVLWDRMVVDDELFALWSRFRAGVRIFVLSDSCHSGTVARMLIHQERQKKLYAGSRDIARRVRLAPRETTDTIYYRDEDMYRSLQWVAGGDRAAVQAAVILISGCQDNQLSADGDRNGLFTEKLLAVWANGAFSGTYATFHGAIASRMPAEQTPNLYTVGATNAAFAAEKPFTIGGAAAGASTGTPCVTAPAQFTNASTPPTFTVNAGANRYFALEVTTNPYYFDSARYGAQRTDDNFFATWKTPPFMGGAYPRAYTLPQAPWDRLRAGGSALYYRIWASDAATSWTNTACSTPDARAASAPSIQLATAGAGSGTPAADTGPSIQAQESVPYASAPAFTVNAGAGRYYAVEVTTNPYYFMTSTYGAQRSDDNFFASWKTPPFAGGNYPATYTMPQAAWERLRSQGSRLYYRLWTTAAPNAWTQHACTTPDAQALQAKSFAIARDLAPGEPMASERALDNNLTAYVQRKLDELTSSVPAQRC